MINIDAWTSFAHYVMALLYFIDGLNYRKKDKSKSKPHKISKFVYGSIYAFIGTMYLLRVYHE